ncbi:hypothetical protein HPB58_09775 [Priestia filamentosa]|uniref:hypothetical protein n=1 Tax=Priestia filamentosa TaxID=1402861 RepID=UPI001FB29AAA|nr:hypothetical protein [Priestia filamentosa]MED3726370.1 hypothetical protein [Priestia filamentosa]UOE62441.1 hypothetical protein HPB58_09775 [Priestia filamentosa]
MIQQVGVLDFTQINEYLEVPINKEFSKWNLKTDSNEINKNDFNIVFSKEEFPVQRFYDIGALVYYLQAIPWQVPNFNTETHMDELYKIHQVIQSKGFFGVEKHRFIIKAE